MKRQLEIGAIFESNRGRLVLKLDAVPVAAEWSGWVSLHPVAPAPPPIEGDDEDEDIPFSSSSPTTPATL